MFFKNGISKWVMVDVEANGPIVGTHSMLEFGAVIVEPHPSRTFYGQLKPISTHLDPQSFDIVWRGKTLHDFEDYDDPTLVMSQFAFWLEKEIGARPFFISDNNGFDWQWINWYFHVYHGENPFGHSSTNLGSFYKGVVKNIFMNFKHLRKTKHTHHPVDDAMGNVEALLAIIEEHGL